MEDIPLIRLLDHTSGIPDHYNSGKWNVYDQTPISSDDLIQKLITLPSRFGAGEKFQYSNGNYVLLAKVIEKVSGKLYEQFLGEKIFKPLNMSDTKALTLGDMPKIVQGYETAKGAAQPVQWNPDWAYGNGALGATSYDLARLDIGLYTEKIVKFSTLQFITTPQRLNDGTSPNYAMGWMLGHSRGAAVIDHDGKLIGDRSYFARFTKYNLTVILVSNNGSASLSTLGADLAGTVVGDLSLDVIPDQNPEITSRDLAFLKALKGGALDPSWLGDGLRRDYEAKDHWSTIRKWLQDGEFTAFGPAARGEFGANEIRTRYRLEQGDAVRSITLGCDPRGNYTSFLVTLG